MKKYYLLLLLTFSSAAFSDQNTRDYLLENEIDMDMVNEQTCLRVEQLGNNAVSQTACEERLEVVNKECNDIVLDHIPAEPSVSETRGMIRIIMLCPAVKILGGKFDPIKTLAIQPPS